TSPGQRCCEPRETYNNVGPQTLRMRRPQVSDVVGSEELQRSRVTDVAQAAALNPPPDAVRVPPPSRGHLVGQALIWPHRDLAALR
ncbi:MAG TPA: hypothetical protein VFI65_13785, partial [Streptosporangiaceae bacterium]|nr:hypothetical protein [Streptosporangiaceae bacterium]